MAEFVVAINAFIFHQSIDLKSPRNLAIIGIALLLGMLLPAWLKKHPNGIDTGQYKYTRSVKI